MATAELVVRRGMKQLSGIQANIMELYRADPNVVNEDALLISRYWYAFDNWEHIDGTLYDKLKRVTSGDSITRARRYLHENSYIEYSPEADQIREKRFVEMRDEHGERYMKEI